MRLSRDLVRITAEIIAEHYSRKQLEDMAQMDLPTKAEIDKQIRDVKAQIQALMTEIQTAQNDPEVQAMMQQNPEAGQQALQQAQGQIQGLEAELTKLEDTVTIDKCIDFLSDNKLRPFVLDIETDSTIYPDEMAEKASRTELLNVVMGVLPAAAQLASLGPQAVALAGGLLKFSVAPYRVGRELDGLIDDFVDSAPQMAEAMQAQQGGGEDQEAMAQIAEAELQKAKASTMKVEADSQLKQAELQGKMQQMQADFQEKQAKMQLEQGKLQLQASKQEQEFAAKMAEMDAKQNLMQAQTAKILSEIGLDVRKQDLEEYKAATDTQLRTTEMQVNEAHRAEDMAVAERDKQVDTTLRVRDSERAAQMGDRQQSLAEKQAMERENG